MHRDGPHGVAILIVARAAVRRPDRGLSATDRDRPDRAGAGIGAQEHLIVAGKSPRRVREIRDPATGWLDPGGVMVTESFVHK